MINEVINSLLEQKEIDEVNVREVFEEIFSGLANEIQTASFLTALNKLNFSENILFNAINVSKTFIKNKINLSDAKNSIENLALNQSKKYIDISLIQDLICSSADLCACRYSFNSSLCFNISFDILSELNINLKKDVDYNSDEFEKLNFSYIYLPNNTPYCKYVEPVRLKLPFDNVFSVVSKMLNPFLSKNLYLGVCDKNLVNIFAQVALKLNKENSIIVSGDNSFPYVSSCNDTYIAEAWKNKIFTYVVNPKLLGFECFDLSEIECENVNQNAQDILEIIQNKQKGAKYVVAILNSALSLYISKKADSIVDGVNLAKSLIEKGLVMEKFNQIKNFYS